MPKEEAAVCLEILRRQRHDFLNHLQVLSGLLQLHKSDQALAYIQEITRRTGQMAGILHLRLPELALRLLWWQLEADRQNVQVRFIINTTLSGLDAPEAKVVVIVDAIWQAVLALSQGWIEDKPYLDVHVEEAGRNSYCFSWQSDAGQPPAGYWRESLAAPAAQAREIGGEVGWLQDGASWEVRLSLACLRS